MRKGLFAKKPMKAHFVDLDEDAGGLKRHLNAVSLTAIGIGAIIGAGIFVVTGQAAAQFSGPAIILSFIIAGIICLFAGLCYAELSSLIPVAGGSYSYSYVAMGEVPAWIVGWSVTLQYLLSASTVSVGWSGYLVSFLKDFGITLSSSLTAAPFRYHAETGWVFSGSLMNLPAMALVFFLGMLTMIGIKAAAYFNHTMVFVKLATIVLFLVLGVPHIHTENWFPFIPENTGVFGEFGWSGILRGAGLLFFAYLGFDTVATLAQDSVNPQKDLPRGILGSLFICTLAYIATSLVMTGVASYKLYDVPDPMSVALSAMGSKLFFLKFTVKIAILAGLATVVLVQMLGQTRMFLAMSKDGLLPHRFSKIHPRLRTPAFSSLVTLVIAMSIAGLFSIEILASLVSMTTLFIFAIVCLGVLILRKTHPDFKRPFRVPFVPWLPLLGMLACIGQMFFLQLVTWIQLMIWFAIGLVIYFCYGIKNSKLRV